MIEIISLKYMKLIFEDVIKSAKDDDEKLKQHMLIGSNLRHYYEGKTNGILEVVDIISKHLGKPIRDDETIEEYYKRWLFGYE